MTSMRVNRLGIDIGGVIMDRVNDDTDTSFFGPNYLQTTPVEGMFEAVKDLTELFHPRDTFIVSKAGEKTQARSLEWMEHHDFYERTGMWPANVHFCRERAGKAPICEVLGITHFIDDKLEVMSYLEAVPHRFAFQVRPYDRKQYKDHRALLAGLTFVESWPETVGMVKHSLEPRRFFVPAPK